MKARKNYLALLLVGFTLWSCTSNENELSQGSLKISIDKNAQSLSTAMNAISSSAGYQALTASSTTNSANRVSASVASLDSTINSISLLDITGEYNYKPTPFKKGQIYLMRYFSRVADNAQMIVRMPQSKVKNPWTLLQYNPADSTLANDYVVSLSKYQYNFNRYLGWDYDMASNINIKNVSAGDLKIKSSNNYSAHNYRFASEFAFANGYTAKCDYTTGDTAVATYAINEGSKVLYEEKYTAIKSATYKRHRENTYSLTIGDVQIVRTLGKNSLDSAKVYVAGTLQLNSKVEIVDVVTDSIETSITNHKREIKITFDDGTSSTISQLLGNSVVNIRTLFVALRQTYFATSVVDCIAWNIYINK